MKKEDPIKKNKPPRPARNREPLPTPLKHIRSLPTVKDFNYLEFKKIADKTPFTQAEWAAMLHLSERTLQRYAKTNNNLAPIHAERALQIAKLIKRGKEVFGDPEKFFHWLRRSPNILGGHFNTAPLLSADGIERVLIQLGRIEHGLFA